MSQIHRQKQSIRATYPERDREREMGEPPYSTSGASANVSSSSSTAPDTAPSPAPPCPRPPPRWPDAGPPMCAACRHRARSRERERGTTTPQQRMPGLEGDGSGGAGKKISRRESSGRNGITFKNHRENYKQMKSTTKTTNRGANRKESGRRRRKPKNRLSWRS